MKEMFKSYGGTFLVVVASLVVLSFIVGYQPSSIQNRQPKY